MVAGFLPSRVMLYDANCKPLYDFGSGPYNMVRWNPFGRFLALAGFGNLPGRSCSTVPVTDKIILTVCLAGSSSCLLQVAQLIFAGKQLQHSSQDGIP